MIPGPRNTSGEEGTSRAGASYEDSSASEPQREVLSEASIVEESGEPEIGIVPQNTDVGTLVRAMASNFQPPILQPHQHTNLFILSFIEGRCRTQAAIALNSRRRAEDHVSEDHPEVYDLAEAVFTQISGQLRQAGWSSEDLVVSSFHELRRYLKSFDTFLQSNFTRQPANLSEQSAPRAIVPDSQTSNAQSVGSDGQSSLFERSTHHPSDSYNHGAYGNTMDSNFLSRTGDVASSLFERSEPQALITRSFAQDIIPQQAYLSAQQGPTSSNYTTKFKERDRLGKGGFGEVWSALHILDGQEYAVKKILITAAQLRSISSELDAQHLLLTELRALAKLKQRNVVRYFDSWIERCPAARTNQGLISNKAYNGSSAGGSSETSESQVVSRLETREDITSVLQNLQLDHEKNLKRDDKRMRDSVQEFSDDGMIVFETSTTSNRTDATDFSNNSTGTTSGARKTSLFLKPSEMSDDDTEELPRSDEGIESSGNEHDVVIFIQMELHPITLEGFLWPEQQRWNKSEQIRHCYHPSTTARIALAILDGIEYIHSKEIVHRDLKPGNIFLSVNRGRVPPEGAINIATCPQCPQSKSDENIYIIPHIGDFGLNAKIEDSASGGAASTSSTEPYKASPLATVLSSVAASRQAGTRFYCAQDNRPSPKFDIYSLGVIVFEMLYKFVTKSERHDVLGQLAHGNLPADFEGHVMAPLVKGMLEKDREKRWDCNRVRQFLNGVV